MTGYVPRLISINVKSSVKIRQALQAVQATVLPTLLNTVISVQALVVRVCFNLILFYFTLYYFILRLRNLTEQ
jgi:hypothetical protein